MISILLNLNPQGTQNFLKIKRKFLKIKYFSLIFKNKSIMSATHIVLEIFLS